MSVALIGVIAPLVAAVLGFLSSRGQKREREILALEIDMLKKLDDKPELYASLYLVMNKRLKRWTNSAYTSPAIRFCIWAMFAGIAVGYTSFVARGFVPDDARGYLLQVAYLGGAWFVGGAGLLLVSFKYDEIKLNRAKRKAREQSASGESAQALEAPASELAQPTETIEPPASKPQKPDTLRP